MIRLRSFSLPHAAATLLLLLAGNAQAADGVLEINQAKALAGGINGDLLLDEPGFPVAIGEPGSYVLTGDLEVPDLATSAILIGADDVTLDLNGFAIRGPNTCVPGECSQVGAGVGLASFNARTTVIGGSITGMGNDCLLLFGDEAHVERLAVSHCGVDGIQAGARSIIIANRVASVRQWGIRMGTETAYANNVVALSGLSGGTAGTIKGGLATGGNICDDRLCRSDGSRRYYLTPNEVPGDQALTACPAGFHMASMWEILDTSNLTYDTDLGRTRIDSGSGPPSESRGWIRTGLYADALDEPGIGNCNGWTGSSGFGTVVSLDFQWSRVPAELVSPWDPEIRNCASTSPVWCIQN